MSAPQSPDDTWFMFDGQNGNFSSLQQVLQSQGVDDNNDQHMTLDTEDHDDGTRQLSDVDEDESEDDDDYQGASDCSSAARPSLYSTCVANRLIDDEEESETEDYTYDVDDIQEGDEEDDDVQGL